MFYVLMELTIDGRKHKDALTFFEEGEAIRSYRKLCRQLQGLGGRASWGSMLEREARHDCQSTGEVRPDGR